MLVIREIQCKSILTKSGISDYSVNCYRGCMHGCVYCYARYMIRFTGHTEPWGQFVDIKVNAVEALQRELKRAKRGNVFMSSACDGWQQIERKYRLSRRCLSLLLEHGFKVSILTKSANVQDDLDILRGANADLGFTLTTLDSSLSRGIEPMASLSKHRIQVLEKAEKMGIKVWAFLGPFLPFITDTEENLSALFEALSRIDLSHIYVDKLNIRSGVWSSVKAFINKFRPNLVGQYSRILYVEEERELYCQRLRELVSSCADKYGLLHKTKIAF